MADSPAKKKRRVKPSPTTVRQQAEQARLKSESAKEKKPRKARKALLPVGSFFGKVFRPVKWLGRHIVPRYFKNSFAELKQVTWPTLKQSRQLTTAVILFALVFGVFISLLDFGFDKVFKKVFLHE